MSEFLASAYAFDLAPYAPVVFGALILLHLPTMVGSVVALRVMKDIDDGALLALRVSPLSLPAYFGFRAMTAALLTLTGLAIATPLSGLAPERSAGLPISMAMAAAMAPLIVMVTAAYARNKVEAMVLLKGVAALSVLLPVLTWMLPTPWWTPLLALPPTWPLLALNAYPADTVPLGFILLGGLTSTAAASMALARRTRSRLLT